MLIGDGDTLGEPRPFKDETKVLAASLSGDVISLVLT
jgi:hypothetical protein